MLLSVQVTGLSFQLNCLQLDKCHICFTCLCFVFHFFFNLHQQRDTTMKLRVGEYVGHKDLCFLSKNKGGGVTTQINQYTASQGTLSPHFLYIPSFHDILQYTCHIAAVSTLSNMNLSPCFVSFGSEYFLVYRCFSCVFPQGWETHSVRRHNNEYNYLHSPVTWTS